MASILKNTLRNIKTMAPGDKNGIDKGFYLLLEKKMTGKASINELSELENLVAADPEKKHVVETIYGLWYKRLATLTDKAVHKAIKAEVTSLRAERRRVAVPANQQRYLHAFPVREFTRLKNNTMLKSYFKIALRNLQKQKAIAFINVFGLSAGIACFSLLLLFAFNEFSFDKFHKNAGEIYRPYVYDKSPDGKSPLAYTDWWASAPMGQAMKRSIPDVSDFARVQLPWGENLVRTNKYVYRASMSYADPSLFSIFTFPLKYGNAATALHDMNDIVLTEAKAKEIFGSDDVVGKTVDIQIGTTFQPFKISAVAKNMPANSTIRFEMLGNFSFALANNDKFIIGNNWHPIVRQTYVQLHPGSNLAGNKKRLAQFFLAFNPNFAAGLKSAGYTWKGDELPVSIRMQPLLSIHTDTDFHGWSFTDFGVINPQSVWILLMIAGGILLIACINFTTLAIARSASRSKEVGVRKVIGADRKQIIFQFLTEALLLSTISTIIGLILANMLLPGFNQLAGRDLQFSFAIYPQMFGLLIIVMLIVGLLAGCYLAFVLSNFKPVEVLKNKIRIGGANFFTKSLVTFQFTLSIILIVSTIIILQQARYLVNKSPGFNKENVIAVDAAEIEASKVFPSFKQTLLSHPEIAGVTCAAAGLGAGQDLLGYTDNGISAAVNIVDPDYIPVMGMHLVAGKNFDLATANDTLKRIIINETMMRELGWTRQNTVGQEIKKFQGKTAHVIGVVKNFNYRPLTEEVKNQVFETSADKGYAHFYVRISAGNPAAALAVVKKVWNNAVPGIPMKYSFVEGDISNYYVNEQKWTSMVGWAGGLSIFLACLGLLGLAALAAINRIKEIGVRKVLGASIVNIINLLLKDFLKLILTSFIIASPIAWYFMSKWLQGYANRISIGWPVFLLAGVFTFGIALLVISFQAMKAAVANPVKSLRTE